MGCRGAAVERPTTDWKIAGLILALGLCRSVLGQDICQYEMWKSFKMNPMADYHSIYWGEKMYINNKQTNKKVKTLHSTCNQSTITVLIHSGPVSYCNKRWLIQNTLPWDIPDMCDLSEDYGIFSWVCGCGKIFPKNTQVRI